MHANSDEGILTDIQHNDLPSLIQRLKDDEPQRLRESVHSCGPPNCLDGSQLKTTSLSWLHVAAVYDALDCFVYLHNIVGLNLSHPSAHNLLPLHYACYAGATEVVHYILGRDCDQAGDLRPDIPHQLLGLAAQAKNADIIQLLLRHGADPTKRLNQEDRPLDIAIANGAADCAEVLFSATNNSGERETGYTPTMLAIQKGNLPLALMFVRKSADISIARNGVYPMVLAVGQVVKDIRWFEVIQAICYAGGRIDLDPTATAPGVLHNACSHGAPIDVIRFLVRAGAQVNRMDIDGRTPASYLVDRGHSEQYMQAVLEVLMEAGWDFVNGNLLVADYVRAMAKPVKVLEWLIERLGDHFRPKDRPYLSTTGRSEIGPATPRMDQSKQIEEMFRDQMKRPSKYKAALKRIYDKYVNNVVVE
jgi:ankyrin repeat protein